MIALIMIILCILIKSEILSMLCILTALLSLLYKIAEDSPSSGL